MNVAASLSLVLLKFRLALELVALNDRSAAIGRRKIPVEYVPFLPVWRTLKNDRSLQITIGKEIVPAGGQTAASPNLRKC